VSVNRPSVSALLLGLIPFAAMCFSVALWDRIDPMLFGIPFNLFWLISWIVLSPGCMWFAYRVEASRDKQHGKTE
jgi:Protein of unknown function (DUF3311)